MANWTRVANGSTAGNISMNVDIGIQSVTRTSNTNVRVVYGVRFAMATSTYTYNNVAAFCPKGGTRYYAFGGNGSSHTNSGTWYYANKTSVSTTTTETCPFTIDIPVSITQTSASFEVGYGWNAYTPDQKGSSSITVSFPTGATAPTGCWCSASAVSETQINLSGGYGSDGGASVSGTGFQYSTNQSNWYNCGSTFTGSANTTYYFRYYASNSQGTSYSGNTSATTYNYPYITSAPNFIIGNVLTIGLYNPLGRYCAVSIIGNNGATLSTDYTSGTSISGYNGSGFVSVLYGSIPNSKSGTYKLRLVYSDKVDRTITGGTYSIKDNGTENPTFGIGNIIDVVDTLNVAITGDNTKFIKGHNTLTGKITPMSSNYGANLDYYSISATGLATQTKNYSSSNINFTLNNLTTNSFVVNAVDKRTLSTPATKSITLINYDNPILTEAVITRQNGTGTYIDVDFKGNYTNWQGLTQNNAVASAKYRYKKVGNTTWSSWVNIPTSAITNTNGVWEIRTTFNTVFSNTDKYDLELSITDKLETVSFTGLVVSTANAMIWKDLQNKYVGIGKKPSKTLDVAGDINTDTAYYVNGTKLIDLIYPVGSIYITMTNNNPSTLFGGTWSEIKGRFLLGIGRPDANTDNYFGSISGTQYNVGLGTTGGQDYHTLTTSEIPPHNHDVRQRNNSPTPIASMYSGNYNYGQEEYNWTQASKMVNTGNTENIFTMNTGGGGKHNNMPPYIGVRIWQRTG